MAVRDNSGKHKAQANLLRRAFASSADVPEACPDPEILAAYADGALDAEETARYELHFSQCGNCREQLAAISRAATPALATRPRISWIWTWGWIALAPVTAMLLIAAILIARHPATKQGGETPLVAMQTPQQSPAPSAAPLNSIEAPKESEAAPAKMAPLPDASRLRSETGSVQAFVAPAAPSSAKEENEREASVQTPEKKEISRSAASNSSADARGGLYLDKSTKQTPPEIPKIVAPQEARRAGATDQAPGAPGVIVDAGTEPIAAAVPAQLASGGAADAVPGNAGAPPAAAAKKASALTASHASGFASSEMVSVESAADRDARTIVRSPDPQVVWRISGGRYVERSSDAGATWRTQWTNANARVIAGSAPSADTCWLVGSGGIVLVTRDGKKWHTVEPPAKEDFVAVSAADASSATITASDGRKFETHDGGKNWRSAP